MLKKYIEWVTTLSIFIRLAVVASHIFEIPRTLPTLRSHKRIRGYSRSRSSNVIDLGVNRKRICDFLLVINSNFGRISYSFRDYTFIFKIVCFPHPTLVWRRPAFQYQHSLYIAGKYIFSGLQFCRRHYGSIFIRLAVVASLIAVQDHPTSSILVSIESAYTTSY